MTIQFDGQPAEIGAPIDTETWLNAMEEKAVILHDGAVKHRTHGRFDCAQMNLLEEIAIRLDMVCLILRGGIDGGKKEG